MTGKKCISCGVCAEVCLNEALKIIDQYMTIEEVIDEVSKDIPFYKNSDGGVTLSGGESSQQFSFLNDY